MTDLISRQAAIEALSMNMPKLTTPDGCGQFDHEIQIADEAFVDCMRIINDLPSAESVHHGKWMEIIEVNELGEPYQSGVYCSECGHTDCYESNYCPDCGAKMDE